MSITKSSRKGRRDNTRLLQTEQKEPSKFQMALIPNYQQQSQMMSGFHLKTQLMPQSLTQQYCHPRTTTRLQQNVEEWRKCQQRQP
jgi:hypothetical protein